MSLIIRDTDHVPPEGWWSYLVPETGFTIKAKYYSLLYQEIVKHCQSNNVPTPDQQTVIDYLCRNLHVPCFHTETRAPLINKFSLGLPIPSRVGCCGKSL